jgi:hypothetical protein
VFIAQDRCRYFIGLDSIMNLLIIFPILFLPHEGTVDLTFRALSRTIRLFKIEVFIKRNESSVSDEINRIAVEMILIILISTVLFMVLENMQPNESDPS